MSNIAKRGIDNNTAVVCNGRLSETPTVSHVPRKQAVNKVGQRVLEDVPLGAPLVEHRVEREREGVLAPAHAHDTRPLHTPVGKARTQFDTKTVTDTTATHKVPNTQ
jgi:hypothetical protein